MAWESPTDSFLAWPVLWSLPGKQPLWTICESFGTQATEAAMLKSAQTARSGPLHTSSLLAPLLCVSRAGLFHLPIYLAGDTS